MIYKTLQELRLLPSEKSEFKNMKLRFSDKRRQTLTGIAQQQEYATTLSSINKKKDLLLT